MRSISNCTLDWRSRNSHAAIWISSSCDHGVAQLGTFGLALPQYQAKLRYTIALPSSLMKSPRVSDCRLNGLQGPMNCATFRLRIDGANAKQRGTTCLHWMHRYAGRFSHLADPCRYCGDQLLIVAIPYIGQHPLNSHDTRVCRARGRLCHERVNDRSTWQVPVTETCIMTGAMTVLR